MRSVSGLLLVLSVAVAAAGVSSCASTPATPPPVDPVGYFEFSTDVEGQLVTGSIEIRSSDGRYTGVLSTDATEPVAIGAVAVEDQQMTITSNTPEGPVTLVLAFTGDTFTGSWTYAGMAGTLAGRRIR